MDSNNLERLTVFRLAARGVALATALLIAANGTASAQTLRIVERKVLGAYAKGISCMALAPQKLLVVVPRESSTIDVWDLQAWKQIGRLEGHTAKIRSVAVSDTGRLVASSSDDHTVRVWTIGTTQSAVLPAAAAEVGAVAVSPDDRIVAGASQLDMTEVSLWTLGSSESPRRFERAKTETIQGAENNQIREMKFAPDGKTLAAVTEGGVLATWAVESGASTRVRTMLPDKLRTVDFSPAGHLLASGATFRVRLNVTKGTIEVTNIHASLVCLAAGPGETEWSDSDRVIVEGASWIGDRYILLFTSKGLVGEARRGVVTPPDRWLRLISLSGIQNKESLKALSELEVERAAIASNFAVARDGTTIVQALSDKLVVWRLDVRLPATTTTDSASITGAGARRGLPRHDHQ